MQYGLDLLRRAYNEHHIRASHPGGVSGRPARVFADSARPAGPYVLPAIDYVAAYEHRRAAPRLSVCLSGPRHVIRCGGCRGVLASVRPRWHPLSIVGSPQDLWRDVLAGGGQRFVPAFHVWLSFV